MFRAIFSIKHAIAYAKLLTQRTKILDATIVTVKVQTTAYLDSGNLHVRLKSWPISG